MIDEISPGERVTQLFVQVFGSMNQEERDVMYGALLGAVKDTYQKDPVKGAELLYRASHYMHHDEILNQVHELISKRPPEPRKRKKKTPPQK